MTTREARICCLLMKWLSAAKLICFVVASLFAATFVRSLRSTKDIRLELGSRLAFASAARFLVDQSERTYLHLPLDTPKPLQ
jgi:hypothetical protein